MIPPILHFTWKTSDLPREMAAYYGKWRALHPGWDIRLWTDDSMRAFVSEAYPDFITIYDSYPKMIQRADAFRYLVLGKLGGIYADLDVEPFAPMTPLLEHEAFLGIEPLEHIFPDRIHQGVPFLLTNAFMGSVPNHALWRSIIATLPDLVGQETFYATGPSMITAMVLRLPVAERPVLLLPEVWSPLLSNGRRARSDAQARRLVAGLGTVLGAAEAGRLVSHKWMTTWVPWHMRANQWVEVLQVPTTIKWWLRRRQHRALAATVIPDPLAPYIEQATAPLTAYPRVHVAVRLGQGTLTPALAQALAGLDYPGGKLSLQFFADADVPDVGATAASVAAAGFAERVSVIEPVGAAGLNAMLAARPPDPEHVLLVDGRISAVPPAALTELLKARRPVVAASCVDGAGNNADPALFRYRDGGSFKVLYKDGGVSGALRGDPAFRVYLNEQKVFTVLPLDGVGESFVLIGRDVLEAGVGFAGADYKLHRGGEGFGIMARDRGFEVAGLPQLEVVRAG